MLSFQKLLVYITLLSGWAYSAPSLIAPVSRECAPLPAEIDLTPNPKLTDPFTFLDGTKVATKADWDCRREELSALFQRFEIGEIPGKPDSVSGSIEHIEIPELPVEPPVDPKARSKFYTNININIGHGEQTISTTARITYPETGEGPYPAIVAVGGSSLPTPPGVAIITFNNDDIAHQSGQISRGQGKFYTLYGAGHSASATAAWTWGISRLIDALETIPVETSLIDISKLGLTGCSRNGKGTIVTGAFEPRIALTIPQESGTGGSGCWRLADAMKSAGKNVQTAHQIITENVWFSALFDPYVDRVPDLPLDHHLLAALIAPRGLLIFDHSNIDWLGPQSVFGCAASGRKVYEALGVADHMGYSLVGDHSHCLFPASQQGGLDGFVDKFLRGDSTADTDVHYTDQPDNLGFVEADWIDWPVPTLS